MGGSAAVAGSASQSKIVLQEIAEPSPIDNNNFSKGLSGWTIKSEDLPYILIQDHREDVGPPNPLLDNVAGRRRLGFFDNNPEDNDMCLFTDGIDDADRTSSRAFKAAVGSTVVYLRYRFVTSEVPGGYFGSEYNDAFRVFLRSLLRGAVAFEDASMNLLGLDAFDYDSGETTVSSRR